MNSKSFCHQRDEIAGGQRSLHSAAALSHSLIIYHISQ